MKVGINTAFFQDWGGGIDFIRLVLRGLIQISKIEDTDIIFLVETEKPRSIARRTFIRLRKKLNNFLLRKNQDKSVFSFNTVFDSLKNEGDFEWVYYNPNIISLESVCLNNKVDMLIPCFESLGKDFKTPWVGYIFDFQHKYMPELFSGKDISERNANFNKILLESDSIIVNSKQVKNDIELYFGQQRASVYSLPFCPLFDFNVYDSSILDSYNLLPQKYFIISNQFWKHKDHITALKAFSNYMEINKDKNIKLVCTGVLNDYRDQTYSQQIFELISQLKIEPNLLLTGFISKEGQKALLQNSIALIQPTLFEGGPGGGAVYEALGMGIPVILSDIEVNKEIVNENVLFFEAGNELNLVEKMIKITKIDRANKNDLLNQKINNEIALGEILWQSMMNLKR